MPNVYLIGLERPIADQISRIVSIERYPVRERSHNVNIRELDEAGMIFAGGDPAMYLALLRRVRQQQPGVPFIVVSQTNGTMAWLDALEAGATDYCPLPVQRRQIQWLMESMVPTHAPVPDYTMSRAPYARRARAAWPYGDFQAAIPAD